MVPIFIIQLKTFLNYCKLYFDCVKTLIYNKFEFSEEKQQLVMKSVQSHANVN